MATSQTPGGSTSRDSPTTVTAASARSRRRRPVGRRAMRATRARSIRRAPACRATQASRSARERVLSDVAGLDPGPARLADAPVAGSRARRSCGRPSRPTGRSPSRPRGGRARRPGRADAASRSSRAPCPVRAASRVDHVPVEVEVVARPIIRPDGWAMTSTCGLRIALSVRVVSSRPRLAAGDVDRGDDEVEPGEQVVLVVERRRRPGPRARSRGAAGSPRAASRAARCPAASSAANRALSVGDDRALLLDPVRGQAAGDGQRLRVVGQDLVGVAAPPGRLGHDLDGVRAVRPVGVAVQVAAQVGQGDEVGQAAGQRGLDLALRPRAARAR